jgi:hypothetical protein
MGIFFSMQDRKAFLLYKFYLWAFILSKYTFFVNKKRSTNH